MSDNEENERKMQEVLGRFCLINKEFRRLICIGEGCGFAIGPLEMEDHLIDMHDVGKFTARRVARSVSLLVAGGYREGIPADGLEAQKGLVVFDGLRCARCGQCKTRVFGEVEKHWYDIGHGDTNGSVVELVRLQSWGDRKGGQGGYWVVCEGKHGWGGERMESRRMEEAAPAEEEKSVEEAAPGVEESREQAVPGEETDLKEIPDNITEESECWSSEEEGQEETEGRGEKENLDGWEGDCFGWR